MTRVYDDPASFTEDMLVGLLDANADRVIGVPGGVVRATTMASTVAGAEAELGRIDSIAGDGDHGRGMVWGTSAAVEAARARFDEGAGPGSVLVAAGDSWASRAGGTSGVLWGAALKALGRRIGNETAASASDVAEAVTEATPALMHLGGAQPGDKTMLDALLPFVETLTEQTRDGADLGAAFAAAARTAEQAAQATAQMRPKIGRARPLAERSVGRPDAGTVSLAMCAHAVAKMLTDR